jgi:hypothetical protein
MGKRKSDDGVLGFLLFVVAGSVALHYIQSGRGERNDAPLIPNTLEGQIDALVAALNGLIGKRWVDVGFERLRSYLEKALPPQAVMLVNLLGAVYSVEVMSRDRLTIVTGYYKQQSAVRIVRGY